MAHEWSYTYTKSGTGPSVTPLMGHIGCLASRWSVPVNSIQCLHAALLNALGLWLNKRYVYWFINSDDRLPEVPPDTVETNTLMDVESLPKFSQVTPASVFRACGKLSIIMDTELSKHIDNLSGKHVTPNLYFAMKTCHLLYFKITTYCSI